jgi:hypothetical protein
MAFGVAFMALLVAAAFSAAFLAAPEAQAQAEAAFEPEARAIMDRAYQRPDGDDRHSRLTLTLTNNRGRTRVRTVESYSKDYGPDRKSVMIFLAPADVKGSMYLSWDYDDQEREDDKWLYLPAMRKDRRISGSSRNESFMGTDFTYDDLDRRHPAKDYQRLLGEEVVDGRKAWVVECLPVDPDESYARRVAGVAQDILLVVKAEYYDKDGLLKVFEVRRVGEAGGYTYAADCLMRNVVTGHQTEMLSEGAEYDTGLSDDLFTVAALRRGHL